VTVRLRVYLEVGAKRSFAGAMDWPGWARSGRDEGAALDALLAYRDRYAAVAARATLPFPSVDPDDEAEVMERLTGNATTDFGAVGVPTAADGLPMATAELDRQSRLLAAAWETLDAAAARAGDADLRTGPRGGGRDLERILAHVREAEVAYVSKLGARLPRSADLATQRDAILAALAATARGLPVDEPSKAERRWSPRFFVRRAAWHVLDHAWEIEDRSS